MSVIYYTSYSELHITAAAETYWYFSPGTLDSSVNKTDPNDIAAILLKVVSNTIPQ
jgi:hypothetical protein